MSERKPFPTELTNQIQAILDWQSGPGHPLTCICGGHAVLLPTVLRTSGTNPITKIALVCPFCGHIQDAIPPVVFESSQNRPRLSKSVVGDWWLESPDGMRITIEGSTRYFIVFSVIPRETKEVDGRA